MRLRHALAARTTEAAGLGWCSCAAPALPLCGVLQAPTSNDAGEQVAQTGGAQTARSHVPVRDTFRTGRSGGRGPGPRRRTACGYDAPSGGPGRSAEA